MKMKKILITNLLALLLIFGTTACFDDPGDDILFEDTFVELDFATRNASSALRNRVYPRVNDGNPIADQVTISLVGAQRSTPINVTIAVDAANTTAVAGTHYNLTTTTATIPANSSSISIPFQVIDDNIAPDSVFRLAFSIASADVPISVNYGSGSFNMRTLCMYNASLFVGPYSCLEPGYATYPVTFTASTTANTFINNNFWDVNANINYVINPATSTVSIPSQTFVFGGVTYGVVSTGTSTIDTCTGNMIVNYRVTDGPTVVENNTHTFTKL
jgi:hypothetical protein